VDAAGGAIGGSLIKPVGKGVGKFGRAAIAELGESGAKITGREFVEVGTYMIGREVLTKPVIRRQTKGAVVSHSAGYVYDYFRNSAGSSSSSYQQNGGPVEIFSSVGDLPPGTRVMKPTWHAHKSPMDSPQARKRGRHSCKKGWKLVKVGGAMKCIKFRRKKARNRGWIDSEGTRRYRTQR
jgi:hypothetical protein